MVTKREYLQSKGLAGKRGRFSAAAKEEINKAINKGVKFDEPEVKEAKTATVVVKGENGKKVVKTIRISDVPETPDPRRDRPAGVYTWTNPDGTTFTRNEATACVECGYSMQWCNCAGGPVIFAYPYPGHTAYATLTKIKAVVTTKEVPTKQPTRGTTRGGTRRGGTTRRRRT